MMAEEHGTGAGPRPHRLERREPRGASHRLGGACPEFQPLELERQSAVGAGAEHQARRIGAARIDAVVDVPDDEAETMLLLRSRQQVQQGHRIGPAGYCHQRALRSERERGDMRGEGVEQRHASKATACEGRRAMTGKGRR